MVPQRTLDLCRCGGAAQSGDEEACQVLTAWVYTTEGTGPDSQWWDHPQPTILLRPNVGLALRLSDHHRELANNQHEVCLFPRTLALLKGKSQTCLVTGPGPLDMKDTQVMSQKACRPCSYNCIMRPQSSSHSALAIRVPPQEPI